MALTPESPKSWVDHWTKRRNLIRGIKSSGNVHILHMGRRYGYRLQVICPELKEFSNSAIGIPGARYTRTGTWTFPPSALEQVSDLCVSVFGPESVMIT